MKTRSDGQAAPRRRSAIAIAAVAVGVAAGPTMVAVASIPNSSTDLINGCYKTAGGALRVIDTQAGAKCVAGETSIKWPASGVSATQYLLPAEVKMAHEGGISTTVITGPVLPPGIWSVAANVTLVNGTGRADTLRCGPYTGSGALIAGSGTTWLAHSYGDLSVPGLVTLTTPERIDVRCSHDSDLPAGPLVAVAGVVVVEKVASRF
jgi:hypothetical protein